MMVRISASVYAADHTCFGDEVRRAEAAGVDALHFDLMDGHHAPALALSPKHIEGLRGCTALPFDVHLELSHPDVVLAWLALSPGDMIMVQWDTLTAPQRVFDRIRALGAGVGLSLNPDVPLADVCGVLGSVDRLVLLTVRPGYDSPAMVDGAMGRVAAAQAMIAREAPGLPLMVDGGIRLADAVRLARAGVDWLVIGKALFGSEDMAGFVRAVKAG